MSATNGNGIHILSVRAESMHRLRFAEVELDGEGQLVRVTGKNGAGKSSLLRVIREVLGGASEVLPEAVNDDSEDGTGSGRLELSNGYTIERRFTESHPKGYLSVVGPDGGKHGQGRINEWFGQHHTFDVLSIFALKPERLTEILLGLGKDPDLREKLAVVRSTYRSLYDERTPHISEQRRCKAVKAPDGDRPEPVDTSAETRRLQELQGEQRVRGDLERELEKAERAVEANHNRQLSFARDIEELERQLAELRASLEKEKRDGARCEAHRVSIVEQLAEAPDVDDAIEATLARLGDAEAVNARLEPWKEYDRAQRGLEGATAEVDRLTEAMKIAEADERRLIAEAGIPVDGLSFAPETAEPLLNGRPLAVASGGEKIRMALDVAIAADPELKVVLVDEGNDLDLEALDALRGRASEHGFQIWLCRIGLEGPGEIVVEDGEARTARESAEAEPELAL